MDILAWHPTSVAIEVTSKCNLRCAYCSKADPDFEAESFTNIDMSDENLSSLYLFCKELNIKNVSLSGTGETTIAEGWHLRLSEFLNDPEIDVDIVANFVRPYTDDDLTALCKLNNLQISFDSSDITMVRKLRSKAYHNL